MAASPGRTASWADTRRRPPGSSFWAYRTPARSSRRRTNPPRATARSCCLPPPRAGALESWANGDTGTSPPGEGGEDGGYWSPFFRLGSTCVFSLNSFQEIRPRASGEEETAAACSLRRVAPSRRSTSLVPPTRRASKPGANGAIHRPPDRCTVSLIGSKLGRVAGVGRRVDRRPVVRVAVDAASHPLVALRALLRGQHQQRTSQGPGDPLDVPGGELPRAGPDDQRLVEDPEHRVRGILPQEHLQVGVDLPYGQGVTA